MSWLDKDDDLMFAQNEQNQREQTNPVQKMQESADRQNMKQEWLSHSPKENVDRLNAESAASGVYGFTYDTAENPAPDIPGMTKLSFRVPDDPAGGMYVGYESFEQTYRKAKDAYQASAGGIADDEAYANATRQYERQQSEYQAYMEQHPDAPDYLNSQNPVQGYMQYAVPVMESNELWKKEQNEATTDIDMSQVSLDTPMEAAWPTLEVPSGSGENYGVRVMEAMDAESIESLKQFQIPRDNNQITAPEGSDAYGQQVVERMRAMDSYLKQSDDAYQSDMPGHIQYFRDGENPPAIPGMTLVVGKIHGAPGYVAGYESYDETYQQSMAATDAMVQKSQQQYGDGSAVTDAQSKADALKEQAAHMYDKQRTQYASYIDAGGNDFLDKKDPVDAFHRYEAKNPTQQKITNTYEGLADLLKDGFQKLKTAVKDLMDKLDKPVPGELSEEQAMAASASYWTKRAAIEPENQAFQERAMTANQANNRQNEFLDIVDENMSGQSLYAVSGQSMPEPEMPAWESTGNPMLDELSRGSTDSVDSIMRHMADAGDRGYTQSLYEQGGQLTMPVYGSQGQYPSSEQNVGYTAPGNTGRSCSRADMDAEMNALAERIQRNGMEQGGMSMGR